MKFRFLLCLTLAAFAASALDLQPETKIAWQAFITTMDSCVRQDALRPDTFLAVDRSPQLRARVRSGELVVYPAARRATHNVPAGLIHDWVGLVFIPNVTGNQALDTARDFDRYADFYQPSILQAHTLQQTSKACQFSLLLRQKVLFIDAALDGQYECSFVSLPHCRWYSLTGSTRLQEILNYAQDDERRFAPDTGSGFIWRVYSIAKYEEADGGVYMELEAAVLSRPIPVSLRWMVSGLVERLSRSALLTTLRQTRTANGQ